MVVGARWAGLSISETAEYWDFHKQPSLGFTENGPKKRKYPVNGSCVDENALLMSEVRGEWTDWLEMIYSCGSVVEHCVSSTKVVGSVPREHVY